jgi:3-oxoacyl-[acyl-carrier protein] reductase
METGLARKGVLVTGGSGGIGAACVGAFRGEGARVVAHYHQGRERADAVGADAIVGGDLRREDDVERVFTEAREALGRIEVCAAVAGVWPQEDVPVWELSLERWEETLRANLTSAFLTARAFLREVERNRHGSLVLIGSTAGLVGEAGHADYAAAKGALLSGLLLSLKNEITRIAPAARVNAVAPGWTESPMTRGHVDPDAVRRMTRTMALRKIAQPEDVARQVVVLASDELSGHVTGQVVVVAGGMEGRTLHVVLGRRRAQGGPPPKTLPQDDCRQSPARSRSGYRHPPYKE